MKKSGTPILTFAAALCLLAGCPGSPDPAVPPPLPFEGQTLTLAVVADEGLAKAAVRLAEEWKVRTGAQFKVRRWTEGQLERSKSLAADAVIYPSWHLGPLVERGLLTAVPEKLLANEQLDWNGVFPLVRDVDASWQGDLFALPFGSPVLTCYYRADLFEKHEKKPPQTWAEYQELVAFFQQPQVAAAPASGAWLGTAEPLAKGWGGLMLLARAAAYARHPYYESILFDLDTMQPLIARPSFVRALDELAAAHTGGAPRAPESAANLLTPAEVRNAFWNGRCAMAITWPTPAANGDREKATGLAAGYASLPGSVIVYDPDDEIWEDRRDKRAARVPLLNVSGRLGSVCRTSKHSAAAFELLVLLSGKEWGDRVCSASDSTTFFRVAQGTSAAKWLDPQAAPSAGRQYADVVAAGLGSESYVSAPRIAGRNEYLAALDDAVASVLAGKASSAEALAEAARRWQEITERLGVKKQRQAYARSLGMEP